ncbi:Protein FAR1-RELATED SEQUENCE [Arachis hypogaea]|nr:Protein FAR1-RELATED SEQUENCE [Arachis hypogaea]
MDDSTSDCQLNQGEVDYEFESNEVPEPLSVVDDQFVPKVGMTFTTIEDAGKFYRNYAKAADFSTRVRSINRKGNDIKNQLITCSREGKWKSKISPTEKTNPTAGLNCHARIYIHTLKDVGAWIISKVVLDHSHPYCPSKAEMLKQHRELSMSIRRTIENNEEAGIRPSKTYQSFVAAAGGHRKLNFIEKDVRNYITREVRNVFEQEDAKEFGKYLLRMKEKNQNFFFELELEEDQSIKLAFWADARSRAAFEYFGDVISFDTTYNTNRALEACMPTTIHRWCIWHIMKKIPSKLNGYKGHAEIEQEMSQVVWNSHSKDSFDRNWNDFLLNFGLVDNKWLLDLYEDRHIWVPIYLDHHFWAGMRSTQRSESMHSFLTSLLPIIARLFNSSNNTIIASEAGSKQRENQMLQIFIRSYRVQPNPPLKLSFKMCTLIKIYEVGEQVFSSIFNNFMVTYDSVAAEKVKRRHTHIKSSHDEPLLEPRSKRFDQLVFCSQNICKFASESEELTAILHHAYDNVMVEMESLKAKRKGTSSLSHEDANLESVNELQNPPRIRTRGRPKNRLGLKLDKQIANATKKKKTKALNELNLFDVASVVHSNSSQYQARVMNYQFRVPAAADNSLGV